jgi:hypothetical protein
MYGTKKRKIHITGIKIFYCIISTDKRMMRYEEHYLLGCDTMKYYIQVYQRSGGMYCLHLQCHRASQTLCLLLTCFLPQFTL